VARDIGDLINIAEDAEDNYVVREAESRIFAALEQKEIATVNTNRDPDFLIYQTARLIVEKIGDNRLKQYQAEAESKAVNKHLSKERDEFVYDLCRGAFQWDIDFIGQKGYKAALPHYLQSFDVRMRYQNFLEVAPRFHSDEWKLVNRYVESGMVPVRKSELYRLMAEKFKVLILKSSLQVPPLPKNLTHAVQQIESELRTKIKKTEPIKFTTKTVNAFPPCISSMHEEALQGKNLSHEARFTLASFLLKIGMSADEVLGIFKAAPDFVRGLAEYQVRHIASKSGGEGYTPPSCRKMQGNSLCPVYLGSALDPLCEYIVHPLSFYETRAWEISKGVRDHSWYARKKRKMQSF
jgi:DNA primase large subunit